MKYIRTKDNQICEFNKFFNIKWYKENGYTEKEMIESAKHLILKQADTIEELCDEFVIVPKDKNIKPCSTTTLAVFDDVKSLLDTDDVYGAIWTDKGLIYVAKMNEKGELKLL